MIIHAYFICKNESLILPYLLDHYGKFCTKITVFDNGSTDDSKSIIESFKNCKTETIDFFTDGMIRDDVYLQIKNNCWKNSDADYVIVADSDEFLFHENLLDFLDSNQNDVFYPFGYNMISNHFPSCYSKPLTEQVRQGVQDRIFNKSVLFNPKSLQEINFTPGCHNSHPVGKKNLSFYHDPSLKLLHYKNLGFEYRYKKHVDYEKTLSEFNRKNGYGFHYGFSLETQMEEFNNIAARRFEVLKKPLPKVSFTITSCNRLDLLDETLKSFFDLCKFPFYEYLISDDSGSDEIYSKIKEKWGGGFKILKHDSKVGLSSSLDILFQECQSDYIFHCEDDWLFERNPRIVEESLSVLEEFDSVHQVYVRHIEDNPHKPDPELFSTLDFVPFHLIPLWNGVWTGFSWNPGLRRKSDYLTMFPNGFSEFKDEALCSIHTMKYDYKAAILNNTSCRHIGNGRHTKNFLP